MPINSDDILMSTKHNRLVNKEECPVCGYVHYSSSPWNHTLTDCLGEVFRQLEETRDKVWAED